MYAFFLCFFISSIVTSFHRQAAQFGGGRTRRESNQFSANISWRSSGKFCIVCLSLLSCYLTGLLATRAVNTARAIGCAISVKYPEEVLEDPLVC